MNDSRIIRIPEHTGTARSARLTVLNGVAHITVIPTNSQGSVVEGGIEAQSEQIFDQLEQKLDLAGSSLGHLAQFTVYLCDLPNTLDVFNEVYSRRMPHDLAPMRCAVGVAALARPEMLVEVSVVAEVPDKN